MNPTDLWTIRVFFFLQRSQRKPFKHELGDYGTMRKVKLACTDDSWRHRENNFWVSSVKVAKSGMTKRPCRALRIRETNPVMHLKHRERKKKKSTARSASDLNSCRWQGEWAPNRRHTCGRCFCPRCPRRPGASSGGRNTLGAEGRTCADQSSRRPGKRTQTVPQTHTDIHQHNWTNNTATCVNADKRRVWRRSVDVFLQAAVVAPQALNQGVLLSANQGKDKTHLTAVADV